MTPPNSIAGVGASPIPHQTQSGPNTVSSRISKLTFDAWVWREAIAQRREAAKAGGERVLRALNSPGGGGLSPAPFSIDPVSLSRVMNDENK